jgi:hypothetical protein
MTDTKTMNTDKNIVDDLQVRCLSYALMRKWSSRSDSRDALKYALRAAGLLGMEEWQGFEAHRSWLECTTGGSVQSVAALDAEIAADQDFDRAREIK